MCLGNGRTFFNPFIFNSIQGWATGEKGYQSPRELRLDTRTLLPCVCVNRIRFRMALKNALAPTIN